MPAISEFFFFMIYGGGSACVAALIRGENMVLVVKDFHTGLAYKGGYCSLTFDT